MGRQLLFESSWVFAKMQIARPVPTPESEAQVRAGGGGSERGFVSLPLPPDPRSQ